MRPAITIAAIMAFAAGAYGVKLRKATEVRGRDLNVFEVASDRAAPILESSFNAARESGWLRAVWPLPICWARLGEYSH